MSFPTCHFNHNRFYDSIVQKAWLVKGSCQGCMGEWTWEPRVLIRAEKLEVRLRNGFPEGETSPKAVNAAGSGAVFGKYLGILRNLKKTSQGQEFSKNKGICKEPDLGSALGWMLHAAVSALEHWGAALPLQPQHLWSREVPPGAGERFGLGHHPAEMQKPPADVGSKPGTQADPTNVASDALDDGHRLSPMFYSSKTQRKPLKNSSFKA